MQRRTNGRYQLVHTNLTVKVSIGSAAVRACRPTLVKRHAKRHHHVVNRDLAVAEAVSWTVLSTGDENVL